MCVHELSVCAYCPTAVSYAFAAASLVAAMKQPERVMSALPTTQAQPAHVVPTPSTDAFDDHYDRDVPFDTQSGQYLRQLPRLTYPHWAVTLEAKVHYDTHVRWSETSIYGEKFDLGMLPKDHTPAGRNTHRW